MGYTTTCDVSAKVLLRRFLDFNRPRLGSTLENLLVAIADEEVCVQLAKIQWNMTGPVSPVYKTEDSIFFTHLGDSFKWEADSRQRNNGVENANFWRQPIIQDSRNGLR